jgi:hypothetical protein
LYNPFPLLSSNLVSADSLSPSFAPMVHFRSCHGSWAEVMQRDTSFGGPWSRFDDETTENIRLGASPRLQIWALQIDRQHGD